jgi:hypothetical protein
MNIDCAALSVELLSGAILLIVSLTSVYFHNRVTRWGDKKREKILFELSVLRGKAIEIRNHGEKAELHGDELNKWLTSGTEVEQALVDKASEITKYEGKQLEWLDRVPGIPYSHIKNSDQIKKIWNLSGIILKTEMLLNKYRF